MEHRTTEINDGFIEPILKEEDYIFGDNSIPDVILQEDGNWDSFLPEDELQAKLFETFGCTVFATNNQIETLEKRLFGNNVNYSDRAGYIMAKITPPGADPQNYYEVVRKQGLLNEQELPWTDDIDTLQKYVAPKPLSLDLLSKAGEWLREKLFKHDWLPVGVNGFVSPETIKQALKRSPLAAAVQAWVWDGTKYIRTGSDTHWTEIHGIYDNGDFKCYDSYAPFVKRLDKNFGFKWVKRIYIRPKTEEEKKKEAEELSYIQQIINWIKQLIPLFQKQVEIKNTPPVPKPEPIVPSNPWAVPNPSDKYGDYPVSLKEKLVARTREICQEVGLSTIETQQLVSTIQAESAFNPYCENKQTFDYGVAQFSRKYYLVEYKMTPQYAKEHPVECIKIMAKNWRNRKSNWVAYQNGSYKNWYNKTDKQIANFKPSYYSYA